MKKRILGIFLSAVMIAAAVPAVTAMAAMNFTDVKTSSWYYNDVKTAYESGIIAGKSDTKFDPDANLTYAEAVKLAACMHQKYMTGNVTLKAGSPWYQSFVDYCKTNDIIDKDYDWNQNATRGGYMEIFANALPDYALKEINSIDDDSIPDVSMKLSQADAIYKLYRAGVVVGVDDEHNCSPSSFIKRSEVSAIITRMMDASKRVDLTLKNNGPKPKTEELQITTQPKNVTVKPGEDAKFTVKVSGGETPYKYEWHRVVKSSGSDETLADSSLIKGSDTNALTTKNCKKSEDGDKYYCVITDDNGDKIKSDKAVLSVKEGTSVLKITTQPKDVTLAPGGDATFTVKVSGGTPPYKYEWYLNDGTEPLTENSVLVGTKTDTLTTKNCTLGEDGYKYYCVITDDEGDKVTSDKAVTHVNNKASELKITEQPSSVTVSGTDEVTFKVKVTGGTPPYKYQWYKLYSDNTLITVPNNSYYSGANADTLKGTGITWVYDIDDGAKFYCVIEDDDGAKVTSSNAVVTVSSAELKIKKHPSSITAENGEIVEFTVEATGGKPSYKYYWQMVSTYDGKTYGIAEGSTYSGVNTDTLVVDTTDVNSGIKFKCFVRDADFNEVTSNEATLTINKDPLRITSNPGNVTVSSGSTAAFSVVADGGKKPYTYEWHRLDVNGDTKLYDDAFFSGTSTYYMKNSDCRTIEDGDQYYCIVTDANNNKVTSRRGVLSVY